MELTIIAFDGTRITTNVETYDEAVQMAAAAIIEGNAMSLIDEGIYDIHPDYEPTDDDE